MIAETRLQIRSNTVVQYNYYHRNAFNSPLKGKRPENFKKQTYSGNISPGAKKRLLRAVELMVMSAPKKFVYNPILGREQKYSLTFVTLTVHSPNYTVLSKEGHKNLLEPFLKWLRQVHGCKMYTWKAELQERGMIHYHLISDCWVLNTELSKKWNSLQKKHGYLDDYFKEKGHYDAPSVKIGAIRHEANTAQYIMKEIAKSCQNTQSVGGKVWDCSINIKSNTYFTTEDQHCRQFLVQGVANKTITPFYGDHFIIYKLSESASNVLGFRDKVAYNDMLEGIRNHTRSYYNDITDLKQHQRTKIKLEYDALVSGINNKKVNVTIQLPLFPS